MNLGDRFWSKVNKAANGCWTWTASRGQSGKGYGSYWLNGRLRPAHRLSWEEASGPIPDGLLVLHKCDNPPCVRPSHLFLGTLRDNALDMGTKAGFHNGKLNDDDVRALRTLYARRVPVSALAKYFHIDPAHARKIARGDAKTHVN